MLGSGLKRRCQGIEIRHRDDPNAPFSVFFSYRSHWSVRITRQEVPIDNTTNYDCNMHPSMRISWDTRFIFSGKQRVHMLALMQRVLKMAYTTNQLLDLNQCFMCFYLTLRLKMKIKIYNRYFSFVFVLVQLCNETKIILCIDWYQCGFILLPILCWGSKLVDWQSSQNSLKRKNSFWISYIVDWNQNEINLWIRFGKTIHIRSN